MTDRYMVECDNCGEMTFAYERYCHLCDYDRWQYKLP